MPGSATTGASMRFVPPGGRAPATCVGSTNRTGAFCARSTRSSGRPPPSERPTRSSAVPSSSASSIPSGAPRPRLAHRRCPRTSSPARSPRGTRPNGPTSSSRRSSSRRSSSYLAQARADRCSSSASEQGDWPCRLVRARHRGARDRAVTGHGRTAAGPGRCRRGSGVTIGDIASVIGRGRRGLVHDGLHRAQHDHEPDDAGRAGRLLPQRRGPPRRPRTICVMEVMVPELRRLPPGDPVPRSR